MTILVENRVLKIVNSRVCVRDSITEYDDAVVLGFDAALALE
jgi:hypothetical protein